jgi:hypothetical protein
MDLTVYTKGQLDFIDQHTRKLMVNWCDHALHTGTIPKDNGTGRGIIYLQYAIKKKWIAADGTRVLAAGWSTAARFLKR